MNARLNLFGNQVAARFGRHIVSAGMVLADSPLPAATQELVKIRASQVNGCGFCVAMHTKDAAHAGETSTRLSLVTTACSKQQSHADTGGHIHWLAELVQGQCHHLTMAPRAISLLPGETADRDRRPVRWRPLAQSGTPEGA